MASSHEYICPMRSTVYPTSIKKHGRCAIARRWPGCAGARSSHALGLSSTVLVSHAGPQLSSWHRFSNSGLVCSTDFCNEGSHPAGCAHAVEWWRPVLERCSACPRAEQSNTEPRELARHSEVQKSAQSEPALGRPAAHTVSGEELMHVAADMKRSSRATAKARFSAFVLSRQSLSLSLIHI